jgi:hypothetical protein
MDAEDEAALARFFATLDDGERYPMVDDGYEWEPPPIIAGIRFDHCECEVCQPIR